MGYELNQTLKHHSGTIYTITSMRRNILTIETQEGHTVRRTQEFLDKHFIVVSLKDIETPKIVAPVVRQMKDLESLRKTKKVTVDMLEVDKRTLQALLMEEELDNTIRLQFDEDIARPLRVFKEAVNSFSLNASGYNYINQKIGSDNWSKLFLYCYLERGTLKKFNKWNIVSEIAVSHIESNPLIKELDYDKTIIPLKTLVEKIKNKSATLEDLNEVIITLPNHGIKSELTYYCQTIIGAIFSKFEFGTFKHDTKILTYHFGDKL